MFQINYKGLKKRDSYDEIVSIIEAGGCKIKYPDRYATQLANSPYMKQIDAETLLDLQDQTLREQIYYESTSQRDVRQDGDTALILTCNLHAMTKPDKSEASIKEAQKQLQDVAANDDDTQLFRRVVGEHITEQERMVVEKC